MTIDEQKKSIVDLVTEHPGIKGTELVAEFFQAFYAGQGTVIANNAGRAMAPDFVGIVNDLVKEGELVEVEYILSTMDYRVKSLYFPKGTTVSQPTELLGTSLSDENQTLIDTVLLPSGRTTGRMRLDDLNALLDAARAEGYAVSLYKVEEW